MLAGTYPFYYIPETDRLYNGTRYCCSLTPSIRGKLSKRDECAFSCTKIVLVRGFVKNQRFFRVSSEGAELCTLIDGPISKANYEICVMIARCQNRNFFL